MQSVASQLISFHAPDNCLLAFFEMSSATNEVVMLKRGMLKSFDMMLKIETATPHEANSNGPSDDQT